MGKLTPSSPCELPVPLPVYFTGQGESLKLDITLTTSDEVLALRQHVSELTSQLQDVRAQLNRAEYLYRCETVINTRLVDLCRSQGVVVPKQLYDRPY